MRNNYRLALVTILLNLLCYSSVYSQKVEVLQKSNLDHLPEGKKYAFLEPSTDTLDIKFIATILAKDKNKKSILEKLFNEIRVQANKLGANCYKINSFVRDETKNEATLVLDSYVATDTLLSINTSNHENNVVFVFGNEKDDDEAMTFKVNGEIREIKSGTYYKFYLKQGEELKISKGGVTGATVILNWENEKQPAFFTLSGFGINAFEPHLSYTGFSPIGVSFNTGRINRISNISLGLLMIKLLNQGN